MKIIELTQGKNTVVDDADYEALMRWKWTFLPTQSGGGYAKRAIKLHGTNKSVTILMHIQLIGYKEGLEIDHIDGDGTNNQRYNLRFTTHSRNIHNKKQQKNNTSGYRGVTFGSVPSPRPWHAEFKFGDERFFLGCFETPEEAAHAYDEVAFEHLGEFAHLNFPH